MKSESFADRQHDAKGAAMIPKFKAWIAAWVMRAVRFFFPIRAVCDFKGVYYESHWANRICKKIPRIIDEPLTIDLIAPQIERRDRRG
jgi:hypothetical protein